MSASAVIVAAGSGSRLGGEPKQFRLLGDRPLLAWSCTLFASHADVEQLVVVGRVLHETQREDAATWVLHGRQEVDAEAPALEPSRLYLLVPGGGEELSPDPKALAPDQVRGLPQVRPRGT